MRTHVAVTVQACLLAFFLAVGSPAEAQDQVRFASAQDDATVTYASDVADILNQNCVSCHRPGGIGPMSLIEYDEIRPWAPVIGEAVREERMPPYAYDRHVGIQELQDDWRLSEEEIRTIVAWVEQGAPMGNPDEIPPPPELRDPSEWTFTDRFGEPDLVIPSTPIDVPAHGNDMWHRPLVPTGLTEDRCMRAIQVKPKNTEAHAVVHHANSTFQIPQDDGTYERSERLTEYAMGKIGEVMPEGVCRIAPAGSYVAWDIHLYPGGVGGAAPGDMIENNVVEIGIWFYDEDYEAPYKQDLALYSVNEGYPLVIPPHGTHMTQGFHTFDHPVRIDSFQPHGHLLLRAASLEIYYPDTGRTEPISMVSNWSAEWHHSHLYEPDVAPLVPAGAVLVIKQWYDNTADNPNNPDPDQWVYAGSRTVDEMSHVWIAVTHLDEEGFEALVAERERDDDEDVDQVAGN